MYNQQPDYQRRIAAQRRAESLFDQAWFTGQVKRIVASILGKSRQLPLLNDARQPDAELIVTELGDQPVRLENVIGTVGKLSFDRSFHPLQRRSRNRWTSIAEVMLMDATALPPIDVVRVGDDYYVQDGHHRVSVGKTLGRLYLDGDVTVWEFDKPSPDGG